HSHAEPAGSAVFLHLFPVLLLGENLLILQAGGTGIQHDVGGKVENLLQRSGGNVQNQSHPAGNPLKIPDVGHGSGQLDVAHALSPDACLGYFHAAAVADHAFIADLLVLAAVALPVLAGSENSLTEQSV